MGIRHSARQVYEAVQEASLTASVTATLLVTNILDPNFAMVEAGSPLAKQAEEALPSALNTGGGDWSLGTEVAMATIAVEAARRTTSLRGLGATALSAQIASCSADAVADRTWLDPAERRQEDVGFSAISVALLTKYLLDRSAMASNKENKLESWLWKIGAVGLGAFMTGGLYLIDGANGGKLDLTAHGAAFVVGVFASRLGNARRTIRTEPALQD